MAEATTFQTSEKAKEVTLKATTVINGKVYAKDSKVEVSKEKEAELKKLSLI